MQKWPVYAPVIIPTLCRFEHFKRCIDSLSRCTGAEYTEVFIGLDYPLKKEHEEGYKKICDYIPLIHGFKNVVVIKREKNYGQLMNYKDVRESVVKKKYDRFIFSEDDNEFAPNFLEFMNAGLERYKDNPKVMNICGYTIPWNADYPNCIKSYPWNAFPAKDFNAMGAGYWFLKDYTNSLTKDKVLHSSWFTLKAFRHGYSQAISRMIYQLHNKSQLPDVCRRLFYAFNNKYSIFPRVSKVKNWGYDGSGQCSDNDPHWIDIVDLDTSSTFEFDDFEIKDYKEIKLFIHQMYDVPPTQPLARIDAAMDYIFFRLTNMRPQDVGRKRYIFKILLNKVKQKYNI